MEQIENNNVDIGIPSEITIPYIIEDDANAIPGYCQQIVNRAVFKAYGKQRHINWKQIYVSRERLENMDGKMPDHVVETLRNERLIMKGPFTGFSIQLNQAFDRNIRQQLDMNLALLSLRYLKGLPEKIHSSEKIDIHFFFVDPEVAKKESFPITASRQNEEAYLNYLDIISRYAILSGLMSVTLLHSSVESPEEVEKINSMSYEYEHFLFADKVFTWGDYERIKNESGEDRAANVLIEATSHGHLVIKSADAEKFLSNVLNIPGAYSVVFSVGNEGAFTESQLTQIVGGAGMIPRVDFNVQGRSFLFGASSTVNNPCGTILSGRMMLYFMGWKEAARLIDAALEDIFMRHKYTADIAKGVHNCIPLKPEEFSMVLLSLI